ncbi:MAG: carbohydrate kinase family protein, partial [Acidobacteria bacterium]|nr:carbohydrate kinase family protein [Acidobacteriota bacterium]
SGSKTEFTSARVLPGGQVATAIIACQTWQLRTRYVGKIGDDLAARIHRQEFEGLGVEARLLVAPGCSSQQAFILVDGEGERTVLWKRAEQLAVSARDLRREWIVNARLLHVDGYDTAAAVRAARWAKQAAIPVVADLDEPYRGVGELLESVDYLIVSRDFPERLLGEPRLDKSLPLLKRRFRCRLTGATLGTEGVLAWDGERFHYARAYQVAVIDTTGAGDIFHAAFIYGLLQDWPLQRQLEFACAAAGLNCTAPGARGGIRSVKEIANLVEAGSRYPAAWEVSGLGAAHRTPADKSRSPKLPRRPKLPIA